MIGNGSSICPSSPPTNSTQHFDFVGLNQYRQNITTYCPKNDTRLVYQHGEYFLTLNAAQQWTGKRRNTWTRYPGPDILKRLLAWKLPLLNLLSQFGRQPLNTLTEASVMVHLVGDPLDTIASMFYTLHVCWARVAMLNELGLGPRDCKAVTLVMQTIDECRGKYATLEIETR
jgi:hypothetical protein